MLKSQNQNIINNNNADGATKIANSLTYLQQTIKQQKDNFNYVNAANHIASCTHCGTKFNIDDIPTILLDICRKSGICPQCAAAPFWLKLIFST